MRPRALPFDDPDRAFVLGYLSGLESAATLVEGYGEGYRGTAEVAALTAARRWAEALRQVKRERWAGFVARGALRESDRAFASIDPGRR